MTPNPQLPYQIISQSEYQRMPWKNGLGETLEIQRYEDNDGLRFRISQAAVVEDGVFSDFSGLHRTLVLLSGNGITLDHNNETSHHSQTLDNPLDIARFSGSDKTHATLKNGKIEDLNIMVRETDTQAKVQACTAPCSLSFSNDDALFCGFYFCEEGFIKIGNAEAVFINAHSMVILPKTLNTKIMQGNGVFIKISPVN